MVRVLTLDELLGQWFPVRHKITREEINSWDWDELMCMLEIECPDAADRDIRVTDVDYMDGRYMVKFEDFTNVG
jgi:hypothetical protein